MFNTYVVNNKESSYLNGEEVTINAYRREKAILISARVCMESGSEVCAECFGRSRLPRNEYHFIASLLYHRLFATIRYLSYDNCSFCTILIIMIIFAS